MGYREELHLNHKGDLWSAAAAAGRKAHETTMKDLLYRNGLNWHQERQDWTCPTCGERFELPGHHWVDRVRAIEDQGCKCAREAAGKAEAAFKQEHWSEVVSVLWARANVPPRFRHVSFANFKRREGATRALSACQQYAKDFDPGQTSTGLLLAGGFGSGKTHLALATARALIEKSLVHVYFATTGGLLEYLKQSDWDWSQIETAAKAEVLLLDDLAQDWLSVHDRGVLFNLINQRYEEMKPTLFTTNAGEERLTQMIGGALYSRLCEMADLVMVTASDFRRQAG